MAIQYPTRLRTGLKEWEAVVRAMGEGKHFLLLHRVRSPAFRGHFPIRDLEFFLLPHREGQERQKVRPEFHSYLDGAPDNDGTQITVRYKAAAVEVSMIMEASDLRALTPFHIWTEDVLSSRLRWDPTDPSFLLTCKVFRVDPPLVIPYREAYGGPDPWVRIEEEALPPASYEPIWEPNDFFKVVLDVKKALAEVQRNAPGQPEAATDPPAAKGPEPAAPPARKDPAPGATAPAREAPEGGSGPAPPANDPP